MISSAQFKEKVRNVSAQTFENQALALFRFQAAHNALYREWLQYRKIDFGQITTLYQIPFLPIEFFKSRKVITGDFLPEVVYQSSGTAQMNRSRHFLPDAAFYKSHSRQIFESFYGPVTDYIFLALLPSYLEQGQSSLVAMVDYLIAQSGQSQSGFFLHDLDVLLLNIEEARQSGKKMMLFGVTYALLDLADKVGPVSWPEVILMETGGMKGRRREMVRAQLHTILKEAFGVKAIHSEYGMTELLSQAYSRGEGIFYAPNSLKILLRDTNDPLTVSPDLKSGGINVIDLANVDSCAFLQTQDLGKIHADGGFEVLGRFDNADIRGCNLLVS